MLDVNPETVCWAIAQIRAFQAKEAVVIPEASSGPSEDWALQVLADHRDDLTYREFTSVVSELEPIQQANLVALMWLGRGDYLAIEWDAALREARESWTPRTADYLIATPLACDYLEEGLASLGYTCAD